MLAKYRALAAKGGWNTIPLGESIKPGLSDPRIPAIRARLSLTDGTSGEVGAAEGQLYGNALVEVVKRFQARQGLEGDGVIGSTTIVAMNVPVQERQKCPYPRRKRSVGAIVQTIGVWRLSGSSIPIPQL